MSRKIDLELNVSEAARFFLKQSQFKRLDSDQVIPFFASKNFYLMTRLEIDPNLIEVDPNESYPSSKISKNIPIIIDLNPNAADGKPLRAFTGSEKINDDYYKYGYLRNAYLGQQTYKYFEDATPAVEPEVNNEGNDLVNNFPTSNLQQVRDIFLEYGNNNPVQLWYFIGINSIPGIKIRACGVRFAEDGIEFLLGLSGSEQKLNNFRKKILSPKFKHVSELDPTVRCDAPIIDNELLISVTVLENYIAKVLEGLASGYADYFSPRFFSKMNKVYPWQKASKQTAAMTDKIASYKIQAQRDLKRQTQLPLGKQDSKKIAKAEKILASIEDYFQLPADSRSYRSYAKPQGCKPKQRSKGSRFPKGWKPTLARNDDECTILVKIAEKLGCEVPEIHSRQGKRNPISSADSGKININGEEFNYVVDVIPLNDAYTSHDDELNLRQYYPADFRPRNFASQQVQNQLKGLIKELTPEVMVLNGPTLEGPPVSWGNYILDGNLRVIALRQSDRNKKTRYYDLVQGITGYRGLLVRKLIGGESEALRFVKAARKTAPARNPILMVGNPKRNRGSTKEVGFLENLWDGLMGNEGAELAATQSKSKKGKPGQIRYKKKGKELVPVYPKQANGLPHGAVPIDELPAVVKNSKEFQKSSKMFKDRYGSLPSYAISVQAPKGVPKVLAGVGQLKQLDYWAADNAANAGDWIHWYHEAGERGDGVKWTRACIVAADPYTGRILLVEPEGSDVKFTNRGIVG